MHYNADGSLICEITGGNDTHDRGHPIISNFDPAIFNHLNTINAGDKIQKFDIIGKVFPGKCIDVYDGDTIHIAFVYSGMMRDFSIRMYGYNSAEIKTKNAEEKAKGLAAKEFMKTIVLGKHVFVHMLGHDLYGGRWLGNVYLVNNNGVGDCVNSIMLREGYGAVYYGKGDKNY